MSKQANFYAIRIVGTDYFMINKHSIFGTFEEAMNMGVFFNTELKAKKRIRDEMKRLKPQGEYPLAGARAPGARYDMKINGEWKSFTPSQEYANMVAGHYKITVRDIELEVVPLVMSIA